MDDQHIVTILYNILCALSLMHSANIVHRDLKSGNILIDNNCGVKICDFGLSRCLPAKTDVDRELIKLQKNFRENCDESVTRQSREMMFKAAMTEALYKSADERGKRKRQMSSCVQTRWYRSPEVVLLDQNYGKASDIWSVGVILSELLHCSYDNV